MRFRAAAENFLRLPVGATGVAADSAGAPESWLTQQAHYELAHLRTDWIKLKRLELA
jgi:hypothetical protein